MSVRLLFLKSCCVAPFTALYNAFHNTTRMPCNRGFTPDEMMRVMPPKEGFKSLSLGPNIKKYLQTGEMDIEDFRKPIDRTVYIKAQTTQSPARMGNDICTAFDSYSFVTKFRRFFGE